MKARSLMLCLGLLLFGAGALAQESGWRLVSVPGVWEETAKITHDGFAWYRCAVKLPADWRGQTITLAVAAVDNAHEAFINGAKVGGAGKFPPQYQNGVEADSRYSLPADSLALGEWNVIAIRVYDHEGRGGFKGPAPIVGTDKQHIRLEGQWEFRTGDDLAWAGAPRPSPPVGERVKAREDARPTASPKTGATIPPLPLRGGEGRGEGASFAAAFTNIEAGPAPAPSQGHKMSDRSTPLPPAEAAKTFTVPDDLEIEQVLAEPLVAQPVFLTFDERGRMWVVEYRQYPAPAGLNVVSRDKFWRAVYDKVPEPPPRGVKGLDRISIHEDTDGDGVYDKHKVFVDGLNIATSCAKGRGGLWVLNPPYLLFYPDKNDDDIPDGDPEVHLEGFGLEDTHSVVNSLRWGPDGWLYAAQGSTVTANVRVRALSAPSPRPSPPMGEREKAREDARPTPSPQPSPPVGEREKGAPRGGEPTSSGSPKTGATVPPLPLRGGEGRGEGAAPTTPDYLRRSTRPGEPPVYSQGQNIWRYHPERRIYEIFAEGGGNAFGVEFDDKGRLFSGHNGGDTRGFHYMQGAYLRKGFEKHGELSNPYAFGYFPQMEGTKGERFSHTFLIYHGGALPARYEGKLFGVEPLQGRIVLSEITPDGSTFKTRDLERVVTSSDSWFRPVDIKAGPDGAIYIADWYDRQVTHTRNQEGNIDTSNGRVYRLKKKGAKSVRPIDLSHRRRDDLIRLREYPITNTWIRQTINRLYADLQDPSPWYGADYYIEPNSVLREQITLDGLWDWYSTGRTDEKYLSYFPSYYPSVRLWNVRLLGDAGKVSAPTAEKLARFATIETNLEVRAQLACTAKRLPAAEALPIVRNLILSSTRTRPTGSAGILPASSSDETRRQDAGAPREEDDARDPRIPLLIWWAIESKCESDRDAVLKLFEDSPLWIRPIVEEHILERLMRRFAAAGTRKDLLTCARLLDLSPTRPHSEKLMKGFEEAFKGRSIAGLPDELIAAMTRHNVGSDAFKLRAGNPWALTRALAVVTDGKAPKQRRQEFIDVLGEVRPPAALDGLLQVADSEREPALRKAALTALLGYDDSRIAATVLKDYNAYSSEVRAAALTLLASRAPWSLALAQAVDAGRIKPADVPLDTVRQIQRHKSDPLAALLPKLWPNAGRPTSEAMQKQIQRLAGVLREGKGDPYAGQKLFNISCASCHTLFARGGKVGPDLTTYQRGDVDTLLLHIVNPSAEIREGFENLAIETKDGRSFSGFLVERDARIVVLRGLDGQNITLEQKEISEMNAAGMSLMPEGLLDGLTDQQARDLFAYLRSTQPLAN